MTNPKHDPWRDAGKAAQDRLLAAKRSQRTGNVERSADDVEAWRLADAVNSIRHAGPAPDGSSLHSASARAIWRMENSDRQAELAEAAGAFRVAYDADTDELVEKIQELLSGDDDAIVTIPDALDDEAAEPGDSDEGDEL